MPELARHPQTMTPAERRELRDLALKLEPRAFAGAAVDHLSPFRGAAQAQGTRMKRELVAVALTATASV